LLPGRPLPPLLVYYLVIRGGRGFLLGLAFTTYGLYSVREAALTPFQLVAVGTALEISTLLSEVPTGVIADAVSRRLSLVLHFLGTGIAFVVMGIPTFELVLLGHVLFGLGWSLGSGAEQAWLSDEIGESEAARAFVRGAQARETGWLVGVLPGVLLANLDGQAPLIVSGAIFMLLGLVIAGSMTEHGFRPRPREGAAWRSLGATFSAGVRDVRRRPALVTFLVIAVAFGAYSEAFDRLSPYHLLVDVGLPDLPVLGEAGWFGVIEAAGLVIGIGATGLAARFGRLEEPRAVAALLAGLVALLASVSVAFALTSWALVAITAMLFAQALRAVIEPMEVVWMNRGLDPASRATVLSLRGQADALGQTGGGLGLGLLAQRASVRASILVGAALLGLALPLFARVRTQDAAREHTEPAGRR
jgi:DHA3 family tetracycline resistance protein-like MFS transporter